MTAVFFPDQETSSESGRYILEARSPHNGTIPHRDGSSPTDDEFEYEFRHEQSEFRYRLLSTAPSLAGGERSEPFAPTVVWERYQGEREDSVGGLVVSDDGWSIISTHGIRPEVIAVGPDGRDVLRLRIVWMDHPEEYPLGPSELAWPLSHLVDTTAGYFWAAYSWRSFFQHRGGTFFAWRTSWGQRLVLDLEGEVAFTDEGTVPRDLADAAIEAERAGVRTLLASLSHRMEEVRTLLSRREDDSAENARGLLRQVGLAPSALHLVGVHQLRDCVPYLRDWETLDVPRLWGSTVTMPVWWSREEQHFRPIVHQALKRLGEEPRGLPTYRFVRGMPPSTRRFPMPESVPDRCARFAKLARWMSPGKILRLLGSPDYVELRSPKAGFLSMWSEHWEYDFRVGTSWKTLRITWRANFFWRLPPTFEEVAPDWLEGGRRDAEIVPVA